MTEFECMVVEKGAERTDHDGVKSMKNIKKWNKTTQCMIICQPGQGKIIYIFFN